MKTKVLSENFKLKKFAKLAPFFTYNNSIVYHLDELQVVFIYCTFTSFVDVRLSSRFGTFEVQCKRKHS